MKKIDISIKVLIILAIIILIVLLACILLVIGFTFGWFHGISWNTYNLQYLRNFCNITQ